MRHHGLAEKNKFPDIAMKAGVKLSHSFTLDLAGLLIDSYVAAKSFHMILNYSKADYSAIEKSEESLERIRSTIHACARNFHLPAWQCISDQIKQIFMMAACGMRQDSVMVKLKLNHRITTSLLGKDESFFIAEKIDEILSELCVYFYSMTLITNGYRGEKNQKPHMRAYAVIEIPSHLRSEFSSKLSKILSNGLIEKTETKSPTVEIKRTTTASDLAKLFTGNINHKFERRSSQKHAYANQSASDAGRTLYEEVANWLVSLQFPAEKKRSENRSKETSQRSIQLTITQRENKITICSAKNKLKAKTAREACAKAYL